MGLPEIQPVNPGRGESMQFGSFYRRGECEDCCPECTAAQPPAGEQCARCGRTAAARVADWSGHNSVAGSPVKREDRLDRLLTDYDRILLLFGMRISWNR